jgi:hypothetical protein
MDEKTTKEKTVNEQMEEQFVMLAEAAKVAEDGFELAEVSFAMVEVFKILKTCESEARIQELLKENLKGMGSALMCGSMAKKPVC